MLLCLLCETICLPVPVAVRSYHTARKPSDWFDRGTKARRLRVERPRPQLPAQHFVRHPGLPSPRDDRGDVGLLRRVACLQPSRHPYGRRIWCHRQDIGVGRERTDAHDWLLSLRSKMYREVKRWVLSPVALTGLSLLVYPASVNGNIGGTHD